jgi:hypothetical protein
MPSVGSEARGRDTQLRSFAAGGSNIPADHDRQLGDLGSERLAQEVVEPCACSYGSSSAVNLQDPMEDAERVFSTKFKGTMASLVSTTIGVSINIGS